MPSSTSPPSISENMAAPASWLRLFCWMWVVLCLILVPLFQENIASIDLWGKLAIPAIALQSGHFPTTDDFAFTVLQNTPWTDHEWLSGYAFYAALSLGNITGLGDIPLTLLKCGCLALAVSGVFLITRRQGTSPEWVALLLALCGTPALVTGFLSTGRPQIFTFAFLPWLLLYLEAHRKPTAQGIPLWHLALFGIWGVVWGNLHAGFVVGLGLLVLYSLHQSLIYRQHRLWPAALIFGIGTFINPYGLDYWHYILYAITLDRTGVTEWAAVNPANPYYWPALSLLFCLFIGCTTGYLIRLGRPSHASAKTERPDTFTLLVLLIFTWFGFRYVKHQPLFVLAGVALGSPLVWPLIRAAGQAFAHQVQKLGIAPRLFKIQTAQIKITTALLAALSSTVYLVQNTSLQALSVQVPQQRLAHHRNPAYPVAAITYLTQLPATTHGNLFTPFAWGEYAFWRLYPRFRVSLDGRLEAVYPMAVFHRHRTLYQSTHLVFRMAESLAASAKHARSAPVYLLTETSRLPKEAALGHSKSSLAQPQWRLCYQDVQFSVLQRLEASAPLCPVQLNTAPQEGSPSTVSETVQESLNRNAFRLYPTATNES